MTPIIEDAVLGTDLDGQFHSLLNIGSLDPVPSNLVTSDDPRLTDQREPAPGSVTNLSVADDAAIDQSKLDLNGQIPTAWLGTTPGTAAQGDLVEYLSNKDQPNGYVGLDSSGQIPTAMLPDEVGLATVNSVGLSMPTDFIVVNSPITTSGTIQVRWKLLDGEAWFGALAANTPPTFQYGALPLSLIPNLAAGQVTSGTFNPARLPLAKGVGETPPRTGCVPDPGPGGTGILATDYLARDMTWKHAPTISVSYQTDLPAPTLTVTTPGPPRTVSVGYDIADPDNDQFQDAIFFYSTAASNSGYAEFPEVNYVQVPAGQTIWVYAAHPGFNNSVIVHQP